jgi:hypothetical protein
MRFFPAVLVVVLSSCGLSKTPVVEVTASPQTVETPRTESPTPEKSATKSIEKSTLEKLPVQEPTKKSAAQKVLPTTNSLPQSKEYSLTSEVVVEEPRLTTDEVTSASNSSRRSSLCPDSPSKDFPCADHFPENLRKHLALISQFSSEEETRGILRLYANLVVGFGPAKSTNFQKDLAPTPTVLFLELRGI